MTTKILLVHSVHALKSILPQQLERRIPVGVYQLRFSQILGNALSAVQPELSLDVSIVLDTGVDIGALDLSCIFNRLYTTALTVTRNSPENNISLALAHDLNEFMGGTLHVNSSAGDAANGSCVAYIIELPLKATPEETVAPEQASLRRNWFPVRVHEAAAPVVVQHHIPEKPLILLVDDHEETLAYLLEGLLPYFRILTAVNGRQGWRLAQAKLPDIIIANAMMHDMDGCLLTQYVKTTPATDHIAVVLLSAQAAYNNQLRGLQQGADDYLTRPFHFEELLLRLNNLVTRQQRLRTFYGQKPNAMESFHAVEMPKDGWLKDLYKVLEMHMDNPMLNVEWLAGQMAMSQKTLLRKVEASTRLSPNELIRQFRLRKATELLRSGHKVSEVAYIVGFKTPAYFGQCFKEFYKMTPRTFISSACR